MKAKRDSDHQAKPHAELVSESLPVRVAVGVLFMAVWLLLHWLLGE